MKKRNKGFTLIELLVVIAIIGILSSIVIASLNSARKKSRDARRVADVKQLQLAMEMYFDACRQYPAPGVGNNLAITDAVGCTGTTKLGSFIASIPLDPNTGAKYSYAYYGVVATAPTYYHIGANLEEVSNSALSSDKDCNSKVAANTCGAPGGPIYVNGFNGIEAATCDAVAGAAGTDQCYDVTP